MKNTLRLFSAILIALLCVPQLVSAQSSSASSSSKPGVGIAVKASTFGIGLDAAVRVHPKVNVRAGVSTFSFSRDFDTDDNIVYTGNLKLSSIAASIDWFPFGGGFHLSPTLMIRNGNKASFSSTIPAGKNIDIGDTEYRSSSSDPVKAAGDVTFKNARPGVTIGWGNIAGGRRVTVPFEIGIIFASAPTGKLSFTGTACQPNGLNCRNVATDPTIQADVKKAEIDLNDSIKIARFFPVLSLGISFRF